MTFRLPLLGQRSGRYAIDSFTMAQGCVIAIGWSEFAVPQLLVRGHKWADVAAVRFERQDLAAYLGSGTGARGFRLCAPLAEDVAAEDLALHFDDDHVVTMAAAAALFDLGSSSGTHALLGRFLAAIAAPAAFEGPPARILEIGSRARSGNVYRTMFPDFVEHVGLDVTAGPNVDVVGDAHHLSRHLEGRFDYVFSISVFEHLLMPWKAAIEMARVMRPGGLAFIQSHATWPLHEEPWDFFRFSRSAWHGLFNAHTGFEVVETAYGLPASIVPRFVENKSLVQIDLQPTFLLSACLVKRIGDPSVDWAGETSELFDLAYAHA